MKKILIATVLIILVLVFSFVYFSGSQKMTALPVMNTEKQMDEALNHSVNITATFEIYTNGTPRTFSAAMYHNLSDEVYIEAINLNLVHIKKQGITWDDFFKTLPFSLDENCLTTGTGQTFCTNQTKALKFYLNSELNQNALDRVINENDELIIRYEPISH